MDAAARQRHRLCRDHGRRKPADGGDLNVSLIDLDEGVRLMSRVDNLPADQVRIGQRVKARVQVKDGRGLVLFDAVGAA